MNSEDFKSSTGKDFPPSRGYPSLSQQTRLSTSTPTASASSTYSGLPLRQEPLSSLLSPSSGYLSPSAAISGTEMTGRAGSTTSRLLKPSQGEWFQDESLPVGPSRCHPKQIPPNMMFHPHWQGQDGIGCSIVAGQAPQSILRPFPSMPFQPSLQLLEGRSTAFKSSPFLVSRP